MWYLFNEVYLDRFTLQQHYCYLWHILHTLSRANRQYLEDRKGGDNTPHDHLAQRQLKINYLDSN